jgi:uncharacterized protein
MEKKDKLYISIYNDYYGGVLTEYQSNLIKMYYDEDLSLNEIAENLSISPQAVKDTLSRAEKTLINLENKLMLVNKVESAKKLLEELKEGANNENKKKIEEVINLLDK